MSLGVIASLWIAPEIVGQIAFLLCQLWLLILPVAWQRIIKQKSLMLTLPNLRDWLIGIGLGALMFVIVLVTYKTVLSQWIDKTYIQTALQQLGGLNPSLFWLLVAYLICVNALFEEYYWRWFVYTRCEEWVVNPKLAVSLSAVCFTLHHTIGLAFFTEWRTTLVGSVAVFVAGAIWSETYRRTRSIWGGYISHAIAVVALCIVAWDVFFS